MEGSDLPRVNGETPVHGGHYGITVLTYGATAGDARVVVRGIGGQGTLSILLREGGTWQVLALSRSSHAPGEVDVYLPEDICKRLMSGLRAELYPLNELLACGNIVSIAVVTQGALSAVEVLEWWGHVVSEAVIPVTLNGVVFEVVGGGAQLARLPPDLGPILGYLCDAGRYEAELMQRPQGGRPRLMVVPGPGHEQRSFEQATVVVNGQRQMTVALVKQTVGKIPVWLSAPLDVKGEDSVGVLAGPWQSSQRDCLREVFVRTDPRVWESRLRAGQRLAVGWSGDQLILRESP